MNRSTTLIILDRDGVINEDSPDYIKSPEEWVALPNSLEAIAFLTKKGFKVVVATNQSGLARGYYSEHTLNLIHKKMQDQLALLGGRVDGIYYCPHGPDDGCRCRKPLPGLLEQIASNYQLSLDNVPFVGDSYRDLEAARNFNCCPVLVRTGNGEKTLEKARSWLPKNAIFKDLLEFAEYFANCHITQTTQ